jgi:hypothetical protein
MWATTQDDPKITDMDPVHKRWMFNNWIADKEEQAELAKNHALLIGSFINHEAVKQMTGHGDVHASTEEEFEETLKFVTNANKQAKPKKKRKIR